MRLDTLFLAPWRDALTGLERVVDTRGGLGVASALLALLVSWWVYVPVHELMHAWGCLLAGGSVTRLEISEIYGAHWLARVVPFVTPGSEYAGRLSGFDTGGSDTVYLVTVFFPYALTVFPGVLALRAVVRVSQSRGWRYGAALPWALAPFLSVTGDYYEMGSILVSRALEGWTPQGVARWRSDDLALLCSQLFGTGGLGTYVDMVGVGTSLFVGTLLAFATYAAGAAISDLFLRRDTGTLR